MKHLLFFSALYAAVFLGTFSEQVIAQTEVIAQGASTKVAMDQTALTNLMNAVGTGMANLVSTPQFETAVDRSVILPTNKLIGMYAMLAAAYGQTDRTSVVYAVHASNVNINSRQVTVPVNFRILLRGQTNSTDPVNGNGLYVVQTDHRLARDTTQENRFISHLGYGLIVSMNNLLNMCLYYPATHQFVDIGQAPTAR